MAPNLSGGRVRSEALDRFLGQHDSHASLEVTRDDKQENSEMLNNDPINTQTSGQPVAIDEDAADVTLETFVITESSIPRTDSIIVQPTLIKSKTIPVVPFTHPESQVTTIDSGVANNPPSFISQSNISGFRPDTDMRTLKQITVQANTDPEVSLIRHDADIGRVLHNQQGALLEKALKETISIAKEEEEWAVVEKQLAEDLSFTKTIEEILQSADNNAKPFDTTDDQTLTIREILPLTDRAIVPNVPRRRNGALFATSSGSPPVSRSSQTATNRPSLAKRTTHARQDARSNRSYSSLSPISIQVTTPSTYIANVHNFHERLPEIPSFPLIAGHGIQTDAIASSANIKSAQDKSIQSSTTKSKPVVNNSNLPVTSTDSIYLSTPRRKLSSSRRRNSKNKPQSPDTISQSEFDDSVASETQSLGSVASYVDDSTIAPTGGGILRIPGHAPESPADLNLVHHDLSLPFLRGQGARVLSPESSMTAEGE